MSHVDFVKGVYAAFGTGDVPRVLGAMYPHAGGDYVYLREAWHPLAGFVIGWLSFFVIYAGTVATLAVGFVDGLAHFFPMSGAGRTGAAVAITLATSAVHFRGVRLAAWLNNVTACVFTSEEAKPVKAAAPGKHSIFISSLICS